MNDLLTNSKVLFRVDAAGALLSSFLLGIVLVRFELTFGIPADILQLLSMIPLFFATYDYYCYFFLKTNRRPYLKGIAVLNSMYCCLTIGLVIYHYDQLTIWGLTYFLVEVFIIGVLVAVELRASSKSKME